LAAHISLTKKHNENQYLSKINSNSISKYDTSSLGPPCHGK
jgi:hypothetical protein